MWNLNVKPLFGHLDVKPLFRRHFCSLNYSLARAISLIPPAPYTQQQLSYQGQDGTSMLGNGEKQAGIAAAAAAGMTTPRAPTKPDMGLVQRDSSPMEALGYIDVAVVAVKNVPSLVTPSLCVCACVYLQVSGIKVSGQL